jgi:hypothetical protein
MPAPAEEVRICQSNTPSLTLDLVARLCNRVNRRSQSSSLIGKWDLAQGFNPGKLCNKDKP